LNLVIPFSSNFGDSVRLRISIVGTNFKPDGRVFPLQNHSISQIKPDTDRSSTA
jgi:hypothetical protein